MSHARQHTRRSTQVSMDMACVSATTWMCLGHHGVASLHASIPFRQHPSIPRTSESYAVSPPPSFSIQKKDVRAMAPCSSSQLVALCEKTIRPGQGVSPLLHPNLPEHTILCPGSSNRTSNPRWQKFQPRRVQCNGAKPRDGRCGPFHRRSVLLSTVWNGKAPFS